MNAKDNPIRVVLLDNSTMVRERLAALLGLLVGVEIVGQAEDGLTGLSMILRLRPDVLILDIGLPGQSGVEILQLVKKQSQPPMVIMLTNYPDTKLKEKCLEMGADFYFHKPTEFEKTFDICQMLADLRASGGQDVKYP